MKKLIITLLAAVLASGALAQDSFPDIPANHWAGDAVDRIADLGIVIGFPDGTYRGNEAFTRYQAALVVSRMLDVLSDNVNAALALTQADVDSLRNAVQELASDVAAQGVRLSAAESAIAGLSDDGAATNARLDELEARIGTADVDPAVLRDLQNQIASQRVALDTAQATADAAASRADDAYSLARQADSRSRENASDIAALNRVLGLMQRDINTLKSGAGVTGEVTDLTGVQGGIERNRSDIANLREFVILLRRDQVALRDQVAALEASDAAQDAAIADLQARVTELEENPLGISGTIVVRYSVGRTLGYLFDVDRVYGINNERDMGSSTFSRGAAELSGNPIGHRDYRTQVGEVAQDRHDILPADGNNVFARLNLNFNYGFGFDGEGSPRGLNSFSGVLDVDMDTRRLNAGDLNPPPVYEGDPAEGIVINDWMRVTRFMTTFEPIGVAPLTFTFGTNVEASFTPYILQTDDPGFIASVTSPDFLSFLDPTLTVAYVAPDWLNGPLDADGDPTNAPNDYVRGARLTVSPLDGLTLGGSFVQYAMFAGDHADVNADNDETTVFGVDGSLSLSIFELGFEWAQGSTNDPADDTETVLYAELGIDASGLPIIDSLNANYRSISPAWTANGYNMQSNPNGYPWAVDQVGFGVDAGFDLFGIVELGGFFDSYSVTADGGHDVTAFGVDASADLFAGFALSGFFHQVSVDGTTVDSSRYAVDGDETAVAGADLRRNNSYRTGFGVGLSHDGEADNALISGLNIDASYEQTEADFSRSRFNVDADYSLNVSIISLTPYVGYTMVSDSDTIGTPTDVVDQAFTELRVGAGLETSALDVFLAPSLLGAVNYRAASHTPFAAPEFDSSELQWSVGLVLNEFIFENSTLTAKYGSWTGVNINTEANTRGTGDGATDISAGDADNGVTQSTSGYEVIWNYWDLEFAYGVYTNSDHRGDAAAQGFRISYTVAF